MFARVEGTREERAEQGRALRRRAPRSCHSDWTPAPDRPDPVAVLEAAASSRVPELVPFRHGRMLVSPFTFLRGAADMMAIDIGRLPVSGLRVQACGDAHVGNFGEFATPERNIVFDINDFDETLPAPWEWDVQRLAASVEVVARGQGVPREPRVELVATAVRAYRERVAEYASLRALEVWYARIELGDVIAYFPPEYRQLVERDIAKAKRRTHLRALAKLTEVVDGRRRFIEDPPLLVRLEHTDAALDDLGALIEGYRASLTEDRRELFDRFRLVDVARKVVGVGSVGTRCWVGLLEGPDHPGGDPLFLQVKQALPSVLEPFAGPSALGHHGLRVVTGQRLTQAASDVFLGWSDGPSTGHHYYVRQLWDVKGAGDPTIMDLNNLSHYAGLCAWALAHAHARTGDAVAISGYLGTNDRFDRAIAEFAVRYGDQTEVDHAALQEAVRSGRIEARLDTPLDTPVVAP